MLPIATSDFLEVFFLLFIWIPVTIAYVTAVVDVIARRHDLSWGKRALWLLFILILPLLGMLIYFMARPRLPEEEAAIVAAQARAEAQSAATYATALQSLADLKAKGVITDAEYEEKVAKIKGTA
jgi:phospholipase D-like protein/putative oligomerization/nucleic acid binding protein